MRLIHRAGAVALAFLLAVLLIPANAMAATPGTCTASGGTHCLSIVNRSDGRILSWRLYVYNPRTLKYERMNCLYVDSSVTNSGGQRYNYANIHLTEGQKFTLKAYRGRRDCGGDMWAAQGWTVGRADKYNYTKAEFTMSDPDSP